MNDIKGQEFRPKIREIYSKPYSLILYYIRFNSIIKFYNFCHKYSNNS